jgi:pimeloyl-ACP methyl ester carboxylesterase
MLRSTAPIDAEAIRRQPLPGVAGFAAPSLLHAKGMVEEYRTWIKPWGFTFEQIPCRVMVWQGDADELVPKQWAEEMAKRIPHARLHMIAGEGHLLPYNHYKNIRTRLRVNRWRDQVPCLYTPRRYTRLTGRRAGRALAGYSRTKVRNA